MTATRSIDLDRMARARFARVLEAMRVRSTDLLLLSRYANAHYASGARRVQVAGSGGFVPWVAVRAGGSAPYVYTTDLDGVPACASAHGRPMLWDAAKLVADLKAIAGSGRLRIAIDAVSPRFLAMLEQAFPGSEWQDGEAILGAARAVKDGDEIACIEEALGAAETALAQVISMVRPGVRERDLSAVYLRAAIEAGASVLAHEGSFRARSAAAASGRLAGERPLRDGDLVFLEAAVSSRGYQAECARTWFVGAARRPSAAQRSLHRRWREAVERLIEACRPGSDERRIRAAMLPGVSASPYLLYGIGAGVEPPWLDVRRQVDGAGFELRAGMTLVLKPEVSDPEVGTVAGSETILIGEGGARRLSRFPDGPLL